MEDLFRSLTDFRPVRLPDADVSYLRNFDLGLSPDVLLHALITETPWRQENVTVWGKTFRQPRLVAWYGDPGRAYHYSGIALEPLPWTDRIAGIRTCVERVVGHRFNSVLLNYYRDQSDSMGLHSDDEKELGPRPVIASVSLGAERIFLLKSKIRLQEKPIRLPLASGSLLLMKGDTQKNYKHGISKETRPLGPRVNLTFRTILVQ
jgi:alkylated DNA repair dioxygenase AlkB